MSSMYVERERERAVGFYIGKKREKEKERERCGMCPKREILFGPVAADTERINDLLVICNCFKLVREARDRERGR